MCICETEQTVSVLTRMMNDFLQSVKSLTHDVCLLKPMLPMPRFVMTSLHCAEYRNSPHLLPEIRTN
jgi:hypothetical protein